MVCEHGRCAGVFETLPPKYASLPVEDFWDKLIIPGLVDLHTHAPQFAFRGTGGDLELLDWLNACAFPEEKAYGDLDYAERAYDCFVEDLYIGATTRACVFGTKHRKATAGLMEMLDETGLVTFVGKVNMDRNVPEDYVETTEESVAETKKWLGHVRRMNLKHTSPIITPRFTPSCSRPLMEELGRIAEKLDLSVQSHLSENQDEIEWVKKLEPDCRCYAETYDRAGLLRKGRTVMAHCVWSDEEELALLKNRGVVIAHCPGSNINVRSGAAPMSKYLDMGLKVGLGSDVAGGPSSSMFAAMRDAVTVSKLRWRLTDQSVRPLTFPEVFYMATMGGGAFFGKVGAFLEGYEFDAVVLDDENLQTIRAFSPAERAERLMYLMDDRNVTGKYVQGRKLY